MDAEERGGDGVGHGDAVGVLVVAEDVADAEGEGNVVGGGVDDGEGGLLLEQVGGGSAHLGRQGGAVDVSWLGGAHADGSGAGGDGGEGGGEGTALVGDGAEGDGGGEDAGLVIEEAVDVVGLAGGEAGDGADGATLDLEDLALEAVIAGDGAGASHGDVALDSQQGVPVGGLDGEDHAGGGDGADADGGDGAGELVAGGGDGEHLEGVGSVGDEVGDEEGAGLADDDTLADVEDSLENALLRESAGALDEAEDTDLEVVDGGVVADGGGGPGEEDGVQGGGSGGEGGGGSGGSGG